MKRLSIVAAAAALTLSVTPAMAQESLVSEPHEGSVTTSHDAAQENSSYEDYIGSQESQNDFYESSYENDMKNEYKIGTTADILWGVGIAAVVIGAIVAGAQSMGIALPM